MRTSLPKSRSKFIRINQSQNRDTLSETVRSLALYDSVNNTNTRGSTNFRKNFRHRGRQRETRNSFEENEENRKNLSPDDAMKLFDEIYQDSLNVLHLYNGDFIKLLSGAEYLSRRHIFQLLNLINSYIENNRNSRSVKDLITILSQSEFMSKIVKGIIEQGFFKMFQVFEMEILLIFFTYYILEIPKYFFENMLSLYGSLLMSSESFQDSQVNVLREKLKKAFVDNKDSISNESKNASISANFCQPNHEAFRNISIIPISEDIFCLNEEVQLFPNKFSENKYDSVDEYLNTQFRLLREDFIRPLRESIFIIRQNLSNYKKLTARDIQVRIYENVEIERLLPSRNGIVYKIKFDLSKFSAKMDWKKSRRFIHGSLLCFTNNLFDTIFFASVIESDPKFLSKGNVMVKFEKDPIQEILTNNKFMMLETKNLFEAYRHVLHKLQKFNLMTLPFSDYLAYSENVVSSPMFMTASDIKNIEMLNRNDEEVDDSQLPALINSLKSKISLIQGPPGTGKTYLGLKIIKYLSNNFQLELNSIGPILVVCYTNHALDQFLVDIISELGETNVLRVGGRSKIESMKNCNINTIKGQWVRKKLFPHELYKNTVINRQMIESVELHLVELYIKIMSLRGKLLTFSELKCYMNMKEKHYFAKYDLQEWLKGSEILKENNLAKNPKVDAIIDVRTDLINGSLNDILKALVEQICEELLLNDISNESDVEIEDAETFLSNQRILDEDFDIMKSIHKFNSIYSETLENDDVDSEEIRDSEGFKTVANLKLIKNRLKTTKAITEENHDKIVDLNVNFEIRLQVYKYWCELYRVDLIEQYHTSKSEYDELCKSKQKLIDKQYAMIMRTKKVIGMTTTGAARYGDVLDKVGCQVVVIEEAAEVLEAHVITSLSINCQQLIMIGDHKQLRPKVDVYDLEINYNMGISLFERLIANNCQYHTLQYQHRMRPEISKCVKPIYPDLKDSHSVSNYSSILGMGTDIYFFNHSIFESQTNDTSYQNEFEAKFIGELCSYLLNSGNLAHQITVLTFYTGQLYAISKFMKSPKFKGIRICVVDNFQGEENDIIILSLVRSNRESKIGFLKSENRLCVALSRAKRGFYVIGNMSLLCKKIEILRTIVSDYYSTNTGSKMPLKCSLHPHDNNTFVKDIEDFLKPCPSICGMMLKCGHSCHDICHLSNPSHKNYRCREPCSKKCRRDIHKCKLICSAKCKCDEIISLILKCGHETETRCYIEDNLVICKVKCQNILPCGHKCSENCSVDCACRTIVDFKLPCNHNVKEVCGFKIDEFKCLTLCNKTLACGHNCTKKCFEECICLKLIKVIFKCNHEEMFPCSKIPEKCVQKLKKELKCGHIGTYFCGDGDKVDCGKMCRRQLECLHICQSSCHKCSNGRLHSFCQDRCNKLLKCGHKCSYFCHPGSCLPCQNICKLSCLHEKCSLKCSEICDKPICLKNCFKRIKCEICLNLKTCQRTCDEMCSRTCKDCLIEDLDYCRMEPCKCMVRKLECKPKLCMLEKELFLKCQICERNLATPYKGFLLQFYNSHFRNCFQTLPEDRNGKFVEIFEKFKDFNVFDEEISKEILLKISTYQIFQSDFSTFDFSYKFFLEILEILSQVSKYGDNEKLTVYVDNIVQMLKYLIKWLDPTIRRFSNREISVYNEEKNFVCLMIEILQFIHSVNPTEYAIIFKNSYSLLCDMQDIFGDIPIEQFQERFTEIKVSINKNTNISKEEVEIVKKVNDAKDIFVEFQIIDKPLDERLKIIKGLIKKCHPDKNKSTDAAKAFRRLNELKLKLMKLKE